MRISLGGPIFLSTMEVSLSSPLFLAHFHLIRVLLLSSTRQQNAYHQLIGYSFLSLGSIREGKIIFLPLVRLQFLGLCFLSRIMCTISVGSKIKCSFSPDLSHTFSYMIQIYDQGEEHLGRRTFLGMLVRQSNKETRRLKCPLSSNARREKKSVSVGKNMSICGK